MVLYTEILPRGRANLGYGKKRGGRSSIVSVGATQAVTLTKILCLCKRQIFFLFLQKWTFVVTLVQVLPKQLIAVIVKTENIYSTLIECLKRKNLQVGRIVGLGFD